MRTSLLRQCDRDIFYYNQQIDGLISLPSEFLFESICASLKFKKHVLITQNNGNVSFFSHKLWEIHSDFVWISDRAFGPIMGKITKKQPTYDELRTMLDLS